MALDLSNIKSIVGLSGLTIKEVRAKSGKVLWKAGAIVTYVVDTTAAYTEEVDTGASCLAPTSFTPTKSGWTFVGWRKDTTASSSVESNVVMEGEPITLYAVFSSEITKTFVSYNSTQTKKGTRYYNNGNYGNPTITVPTGATYSGWTWRGWSAASKTAADDEVAWANGAAMENCTTDTTYYGLYEKKITVTYYNNSTTASTATGMRYYNAAGNYKNPSFKLTQAASTSGGTARGWSTTNKGDASITYNNGATFTRETDITLYGLYQWTVTLNTVANGSSTPSDKTRYWAPAGYINPTFTVSNPSKSGAKFLGWSTGNDTTVEHTSISNMTLTANTTLYAVFKYSDVAMADKRINRDTPLSPADAEGQGIYVTLASSVDFSKYYAATIVFGEQYTGSLTLNQNFVGSTVKLLAKCGSDSVVLYSDYINAYSEHETTARSGTKTLTFSKTSGSAALIVTPGGDGHCDNCYVNASGTLLGRTVVG